MASFNEKLAHRLSWMIFICLTIQLASAISNFNDVPPPPERPDHFHSREELKRYLQRVHEYYTIIGRPRFGRSLDKLKFYPNDDFQTIHYVPSANDDSMRFDDFHDRLKK